MSFHNQPSPPLVGKNTQEIYKDRWPLVFTWILLGVFCIIRVVENIASFQLYLHFRLFFLSLCPSLDKICKILQNMAKFNNKTKFCSSKKFLGGIFLSLFWIFLMFNFLLTICVFKKNTHIHPNKSLSDFHPQVANSKVKDEDPVTPCNTHVMGTLGLTFTISFYIWIL